MTGHSRSRAQLSFDRSSLQPVRTINYLGAKVRLLPAITEAVQAVAPIGTTVCDLFSGSAVVARSLAEHFDVVAVDIQEYARVLASAVTMRDRDKCSDETLPISKAHPALESIAVRRLIDFENAALDSAAAGQYNPICDLLDHGSILASKEAPESLAHGLRELLDAADTLETGPHTVLTRYYGGIYFSYQQAADLDALASEARAIRGRSRDLVLAAVMIAASEVVSTVGSHFAQPIRPRTPTGTPKASAIRSIIPRRRKSAVRAFREALSRLSTAVQPTHYCKAICADFRNALEDLPLDTSAVYADPPYTRDHYSRFYHVLETIALGDEPDVSTVVTHGTASLSRGMYRSSRHQSPFCIRSEASLAFEDLFTAVGRRRIPLVLSYSPYGEGAHPRVMTIDEIERLAGGYFSDIQRWPVERLAHSKLNAGHLNLDRSFDAEVMLVCRP